MHELRRGLLAIKYIAFELLPVFLIGVTIFVLVLVMFQSFQLSEYIIIHGARLTTVLQMVIYVTLGFLPILLPIALLFAVLLTYGRMSGDSEIVAMKALGLRPIHLLLPALTVGLCVSILSLQLSFRLAPWGNRELNNLLTRIEETRPTITIRNGVFAEGAFDMVIYANKVDAANNLLHHVFIYDERNPKSPLTIIAKKGRLITHETKMGQAAYLQLSNGSVHKSSAASYTKIDFSTYDIKLFDPNTIKKVKIGPQQMNMSQLYSAIHRMPKTNPNRIDYLLEWNTRWALSATCLILALVGMGLGTTTNRRTARSGSMVICISAVVIYWALYVAFESLAQSGKLPVPVAVWMTNLIFLIFGLFQYQKVRES